MHKTCNRCLLSLPNSEFSKSHSAKDGLQSKCKACDKVANSKWRAANDRSHYFSQQRLKDRRAEYKKSHRYIGAAGTARRRARIRNSSLTLSEEEQKSITEIYKRRDIMSSSSSETYHVDHIIPLSKGGMHHPDNLQIITATENLRKGAKLFAIP